MKDTVLFNLYFQVNCANAFKLILTAYCTLKLYTYLNSVALYNEKNNSAFIQTPFLFFVL